MAQLSLGLFEQGSEVEVDFIDLFSLIKGMSIKSAADWGEGRFEIGLSGGLLLRIFQTPDGLSLNVVSTINKDEISPLILVLPSETERPSAGDLEKRLHGLRQLYAIVYLLDRNDTRLGLFEKYAEENIYFDIESACLGPDERLYIESFAPGSWITTIWTKTKEAKSALTLLAGTVYREGRENMLRRIKAETRIKEVEAESKEFELFTRKLDYVQKISKKSPGLKELVDLRIETALSELLEAPKSNVKVVEVKTELAGVTELPQS